MDGSAVAGLIKSGTFLWEAYQLYKNAPEFFKKTSRQVLSLHAALATVDEALLLRPPLSASQEVQFRTVRDGCNELLNELHGKILEHNNLDVIDRVTWPSKDIDQLRSELTLSFTLLTLLVQSLK